MAEAVSGQRQEGEANLTLTRLGVAIFFTMSVMVFTLALWSQDVYATGENPRAELLFELYRYACLLFSLPVVFLLGRPLIENALEELWRGRPGVDLLLSAGVAAAFVFSLVSTLRGSGHVYYEVTCMVLVAVTLGRWLEATGRQKITAAVSALEKLLPAEVQREEESGEHTVPLAEVAVGEVVRVSPGQRIPLDGELLVGPVSVDEQIVTGESRPVVRHAGDAIYGGTLNLDGDLRLRATATAQEGTLPRMVAAVRAAALKKDRYQRLADRLAAWFLPLVILIALAVLVGHGVAGSFETGLLTALAVLLIACPCALGLATPLAIWAALGVAARHGVLFRDGDALTRLARVKAMCLDKTGTLTSGQTEVAWISTDADTATAEILTAAGTLAARSIHGLSKAIVQYTKGEISPAALAELELLPGRGLSGLVSSCKAQALLGSPQLMEEHALEFPPHLRGALSRAGRDGLPVCCVGWGGRVRAVFAFREELRPEAAELIAWCERQHIRTLVLSGDASSSLDWLSQELNVEVRSGLLPEEKVAAVESLRGSAGSVAMLGDGVNDAPALVAADVGVAMSCGADISRDAAHVCLLGDDLRLVPWSVGLAEATVRTVRFNLFWAFAYNTVGIGLAAAGVLNPILAAVAMAASSFLVVSASLRLSGYRAARQSAGRPAMMPSEAEPAETADREPLILQPGIEPVSVS